MLPGHSIIAAVHGGAGNISEGKYPAERLKSCKDTLIRALEKTGKLITSGRSALDAVEAAVVILEDSGLFNAGKGSVYSHYETHEFDATIMDGNNLLAGGVASVPGIRNPVKLARRVMENSKHVLVSGERALLLAREFDLKIEDPSYFHTDYQMEKLRKVQEQQEETKYGTVGAVALDQQGSLASATSSGGIVNKKYGRIGDSAIVGAGTYANNNTCAVSCTGEGEYFIRNICAYDVSALMEYKGWGIEKSSNFVIFDKLKNIHGSGGLIALDQYGNFCAPFNTSGMFRGNLDRQGLITVVVFQD